MSFPRRLLAVSTVRVTAHNFDMHRQSASQESSGGRPNILLPGSSSLHRRAARSDHGCELLMGAPKHGPVGLDRPSRRQPPVTVGPMQGRSSLAERAATCSGQRREISHADQGEAKGRAVVGTLTRTTHMRTGFKVMKANLGHGRARVIRVHDCWLRRGRGLGACAPQSREPQLTCSSRYSRLTAQRDEVRAL